MRVPDAEPGEVDIESIHYHSVASLVPNKEDLQPMRVGDAEGNVTRDGQVMRAFPQDVPKVAVSSKEYSSWASRRNRSSAN